MRHLMPNIIINLNIFSTFGAIFSFLDYQYFVRISAPKSGQFFIKPSRNATFEKNHDLMALKHKLNIKYLT